MGTGQLIVLDDQTDVVAMLRNLQKFSPANPAAGARHAAMACRGPRRLSPSMEAGQGRPADIGLLQQQTRLLGPGRTFCAHAPGAMEPLQSALKYFRADFDRAAKVAVAAPVEAKA